jgi:hypothetical protein
VELYLHSPIRLHGVMLKLIKHRDNFTFFSAYILFVFSRLSFNSYSSPPYHSLHVLAGFTAILSDTTWLSSLLPGQFQDNTSIRTRPFPYKCFLIHDPPINSIVRRHITPYFCVVFL